MRLPLSHPAGYVVSLPRETLSNLLQTYEGGYGQAPFCEAQGSFLLSFFLFSDRHGISSRQVAQRTRLLLPCILHLESLSLRLLHLQSVKQPYAGSYRIKTNLVVSAAGQIKMQTHVIAFGAAHRSRSVIKPRLLFSRQRRVLNYQRSLGQKSTLIPLGWQSFSPSASSSTEVSLKLLASIQVFTVTARSTDDLTVRVNL